MSLLPRSVFSRGVFGGIFRSQWMRICLVCLCSALLGATFLLLPIIKRGVRANRLRVEDVARKYPNFTAEQRLAILREIQSELHPRGRDLTWEELVARFAKFFTAPSNGLAPAANFTGNLTIVAVSGSDLFALNQQSDCSLTLDDAAYTVDLSVPTFGYTLAGSTPHYEVVLHNAAGLTTTGGNYPVGCGNTNVGITSRKIVFPGTTTSNVRVYAGHFYNSLVGRDQIFVSTAQTNDTFEATTILSDPNSVVDLATADLNGDGNGDLVSIEDSTTSGANAEVTVFTGKADGTFLAHPSITLPGTNAISAVIDDFNGDGKKDLVVATTTFGTSSTTYYLSFLAGNGDGTFQAIQNNTETPPSSVTNISSSPYFGLISADLRGSGHKDLVTSAGILLLGNGNGTFAQSATLAFPTATATSSSGPNVVAGDFNKDGKPDLAVDNGATIQIFTGKGDGTFTLKSSYSTINNVGYLVAQDIDGDGNLDLWSGDGNNGSLGSDQFDYNLGYALMGNGDGTFRGAPSQPVAYTGSNLGSLKGGGSIDAVGVNSNSTFTSYLGDGRGNFATGASFAYSPIMLGGSSYTVNGLDSYAVGDVDGDGLADLVYIGSQFYGPNYVPGVFVAIGKGDGSFNTPVFVPAPGFVQAPDIDVNPVIAGIHLADMNHDGKLDLVYTYNTYSYNLHIDYFGVAVQLGNGNGTFQTTSTLTQLYSGANAPNPGAYQIGLIGNVNNDANPDMLILSGLSGNSQNFTLQVYLGTGTGSFGTPKTVAGVTPGGIFQGYSPVVLEDMNNDGTPDLVDLQPDTVSGNLQIAIALGNGDGTFKTPNLTTYASQFIFDTGLAVADFDGDGKLDVATMSYLGPPGSGIALGNGDGTLKTGGTISAVTPVQFINVGSGSATVAMDLNGDGKPDILNGSVVLINQGASSTGTLLTPSVTVTPGASSITTAQSLMVTVTVNGGTGNPTPTGSVTLSSGAYTSAATALSSGSATITIAAGSLATGTDTLAAVYTPDAGSTATYTSASGSNSVTVTTVATPDFALSNGGNLTVNAGATTGNTSTITVTPSGGFTGSVALTCAVAGPVGATHPATCGLSPASVSITDASAQSSTLTASTTAATSAGLVRPLMRGVGWYASGGAVLACLLLFGVPVRRRGWRAMLGVFVLLVLLAGGVVSCGGGGKKGGGGGGGGGSPGTTAGTYTITITGASGATTKTTVVTLTVH